MTEHHAPPPGPPPRQSTLDTEPPIPDEAPPAYSQVAAPAENTITAGPSRMDFSGPPPLPDRFQNHQNQGQHGGLRPDMTANGMGQGINGVGYGYGVRPDHTGSPSGWQSPQNTGFGGSANGSGYRPPEPPRHPSITGSGSAYRGQQPSKGSGNNGPSGVGGSGGTQDFTPTEVPTPGRPLLHKGMLLVYPKGHMCSKCGNTGYKANDPGNPCSSDWRKYGKPYNSALAHSYSLSPTSASNPTTSLSQNFQAPLPLLHSPQHPPPQQNPYGHLPPPPGGSGKGGGWHQPPGHGFGPGPGPGNGHGYGHMQNQMGPPQQIMIQHTPAAAPPGALVVRPGDPRIGGRLCNRCGGSGRELSFFGFDDGRCWDCMGTGRLF